ncbi:MAG: serine--tRNA ligase, partial [Bacteroidia bacterium]|nr:serine--tRNA ligase [Bacteroidia bacterium]
MLQVPFIRENTDLVIAKLGKRNIDARPLIDKVIDLDEQRRNTQTKLDSVLAQSNTLSKEIGNLFKSGKAEEANRLKLKTTELKE